MFTLDISYAMVENDKNKGCDLLSHPLFFAIYSIFLSVEQASKL